MTFLEIKLILTYCVLSSSLLDWLHSLTTVAHPADYPFKYRSLRRPGNKAILSGVSLTRSSSPGMAESSLVCQLSVCEILCACSVNEHLPSITAYFPYYFFYISGARQWPRQVEYKRNTTVTSLSRNNSGHFRSPF